MNSITIFRKGLKLMDIKPSEDSSQRKAIMGDNVVALNFEMSFYAEFQIGDTATIYGEDYIVNALPVVTEYGSNHYKYALNLESTNNDLAKTLYLMLGEDNSLSEVEFPLTGSAQTFMDLLLKNLERTQPGVWTLGEVLVTGNDATLTFNSENCLQVLARLATHFQTEFWIEGRTMSLVKKVKDTGYLFKVGQNEGLYEATRLNEDSSSIVTRLFPKGSTKNIPHYYPGGRLRLPVNVNKLLVTGVTWFVFPNAMNNTVTFNWSPPTSPEITGITIEWRPVGMLAWREVIGGMGSGGSISTPKTAVEVRFRSVGLLDSYVSATIIVESGSFTPALPDVSPAYIDKNINLYGIREGVQKFEEIYPNRTGTVTSINEANIYEFTDALMDFNINFQQLPGLTPKVVFKTGQLAGYTFDIERYDAVNKRFYILKNKQETIDVPGDLKIQLGDTYTLVDLEMPQSYIDKAENDLYAAALSLLDEISQPQLTVAALTDQKYLKNRRRTLQIGEVIWIVSEKLGINRKIRITGTTRNLVHEYKYDLLLSDTVQIGTPVLNQINNTERGLHDFKNEVQKQDVFNGRMVLPTTNTSAGFDSVVIKRGTNELFRLI